MHINNFKKFFTNTHQLLRDPRGRNGKQDSVTSRVEPNMLMLH